jgi:hypothetical protein
MSFTAVTSEVSPWQQKSLKLVFIGQPWGKIVLILFNYLRSFSYSPISVTPPEVFHGISSPWPFHTWGIDQLGPFRRMEVFDSGYWLFYKADRNRASCNNLSRKGGNVLVKRSSVPTWYTDEVDSWQWDSICKQKNSRFANNYRSSKCLCR